jgi:hypothetical protein
MSSSEWRAVKIEDAPIFTDEKPLAYIDQNILDHIIKGFLPGMENYLRENYRVVYSKYTLDEIAYAGRNEAKYSKEFLDLLGRLNSFFIRPLTDGNFVEQEQLAIRDSSPHKIYAEHISNTEYEYVELAIYRLMQKLYGGLPGTTLADLSKDDVQMFERLTMETDAKIADLEQFLPELSALLKDEVEVNSGDITQKETASLQDTLPNLIHMLKEQNEAQNDRFEGIVAKRIACMDSVNDDPNWSPINDFRKATKLQPHHLKSIKFPDVIGQIWKILSEIEGLDTLSLETFFRIDQNYINPGQAMTTRQKVSAMYSMLNYIGYEPDTKLHNDKGFRRSLNDMGHVSMASGVDCLVTGDDRMVMKAAAIYEFLGNSTVILHTGVARQF